MSGFVVLWQKFEKIFQMLFIECYQVYNFASAAFPKNLRLSLFMIQNTTFFHISSNYRILSRKNDEAIHESIHFLPSS